MKKQGKKMMSNQEKISEADYKAIVKKTNSLRIGIKKLLEEEVAHGTSKKEEYIITAISYFYAFSEALGVCLGTFLDNFDEDVYKEMKEIYINNINETILKSMNKVKQEKGSS